MATYGAKYIKFAPIKNEPADTIPVYENAVQIAELQRLSDNPTYSEGKQYGDNHLVEYVSEFNEADVDVEVTDLDNNLQHVIFGADLTGTAQNEELAFGGSDNAPFGGLGAVVCRMRGNVKSYQGILYTKVKASMQGEEYSSKGENITLTGGKLKFKATEPNYGKWKIKSPMFPTEEAAKGWVDTKLPTASKA